MTRDGKTSDVELLLRDFTATLHGEDDEGGGWIAEDGSRCEYMEALS